MLLGVAVPKPTLAPAVAHVLLAPSPSVGVAAGVRGGEAETRVEMCKGVRAASCGTWSVPGAGALSVAFRALDEAHWQP